VTVGSKASLDFGVNRVSVMRVGGMEHPVKVCGKLGLVHGGAANPHNFESAVKSSVSEEIVEGGDQFNLSEITS